MQGYEQPPGGPPGDPLDDPFGNPLGDPRNNPIDPFANDPFDAMFDSLTGGTGFCFDRLRPTGDIVASTGGTTSGPVSFMGVFSEGTSAIQQGAFRRGANMGMLSVEHPDILNFIYAKRKLSVFNNFNLSIKVTDEFMEKLQNDPQARHVVTNPRTKEKYVIPRSVGTKPYTLNNLVPIEKSSETDCYTTRDIWNIGMLLASMKNRC